ncbi:MAG: hypothetical protein L6R41_003497 [Letrouitia leprolyta]|nr:MAG: hypothetical protein L6R41_003497 [Letrouitia leprolyta]
MPGLIYNITMDNEGGSRSMSVKPDLGLFLIQSSDDIVYEQDILRDPASIKPWLTYIDHKYQYGTLLERAFIL